MTETSGVSVSGCVGAAGCVAAVFMRAMVADGGEARVGVLETSRPSDHSLRMPSTRDMPSAILSTSFRCKSLDTLAKEATTSRSTGMSHFS